MQLKKDKSSVLLKDELLHLTYQFADEKFGLYASQFSHNSQRLLTHYHAAMTLIVLDTIKSFNLYI